MRFDRWRALQIATAVAAASACSHLNSHADADRQASQPTPVLTGARPSGFAPVAVTLLAVR